MGLGLLNFYKLDENASIPHFATQDSACFDFHACLTPGNKISYRDEFNNILQNNEVKDDSSFTINPHHRALIPTGLIADIQSGYSVRVHPRSGLSFKSGVALCNQEGVIDADYKEEIFISVYNFSGMPKTIIHNERIAQGELVAVGTYLIREINVRPEKTTERSSGFGSTGS